jgi:putative salt-induced outer membrane protein
MTGLRRLLPAVALLAALPAAAAAQAKATSFTGDIAYVSTGGNTSVSTLSIGDKFVVQSADKRVIFTQVLGIVYGRSEGVKNAENYRAQVRLDYGLDQALYLFGRAGWERNTFGGIARRFEETVGLAWRAIRLPSDELTLEGGLSLVQQRNVVDGNGGLDNNFTAGRAGADYRHTFSKHTFISQSVEFIPSFEDGSDWRLNSESALVAPVSSNIGLKVGYVIRYDNLPGLKPGPNPGRERLKKTDRFFTAGLTISY